MKAPSQPRKVCACCRRSAQPTRRRDAADRLDFQAGSAAQCQQTKRKSRFQAAHRPSRSPPLARQPDLPPLNPAQPERPPIIRADDRPRTPAAKPAASAIRLPDHRRAAASDRPGSAAGRCPEVEALVDGAGLDRRGDHRLRRSVHVPGDALFRDRSLVRLRLDCPSSWACW